jgi:hypothetical protein
MAQCLKNFLHDIQYGSDLMSVKYIMSWKFLQVILLIQGPILINHL